MELNIIAVLLFLFFFDNGDRTMQMYTYFVYELDVQIGEVQAPDQEAAYLAAKIKFGYSDDAPIYCECAC